MIYVWIQAFESIRATMMSGQIPDFMASLMPGPGLLKIAACFTCKTFKLCDEMTEDERKALEEYARRQEKMAREGGGL